MNRGPNKSTVIGDGIPRGDQCGIYGVWEEGVGRAAKKRKQTLAIVHDKSEMKRRYQNSTVGYDKLQLFRIYSELHSSTQDGIDSVIQKFVNETFHIENEYLMQLNPHKFDNIPEYIVQECDRVMVLN